MAGGVYRFKGEEHHQGAQRGMVRQIRWGKSFPISAHTAKRCDSSQTFSYHRAWIYWTGQKSSPPRTLEIHSRDPAIKRQKFCIVRRTALHQVRARDHAILQRATLLLGRFLTDSHLHRALRNHASLWLPQGSYRLHQEVSAGSGRGGNLEMVYGGGQWKCKGVSGQLLWTNGCA